MSKKLLVVPIILLVCAATAVYFTQFATLYVPVNNVATLTGRAPALISFLTFYENRDDISIEFTNEPAWVTPGRLSVELSLSSGFRSTNKTAYVYILEPRAYTRLEVGTPVNTINAQHFLHGAENIAAGTVFVTQVLTVLPDNTYQTGYFPVEILLNGHSFMSAIDVVDTTPPTATVVPFTSHMGEIINPNYFVTDIFDYSPPVTIAFADIEPDIFNIGTQNVDISLTDRYGNSTIYTAVLDVLPNTINPQILGAVDLSFEVDSATMFRRGVSAIDAFGHAIEFSVDDSNVNTAEIGTYPLTYRAVDCCGNVTEVTVQVNIVAINPDEVRERATTVLEHILQEDMTQVEQSRAIFDWITDNVGYAAGFEHRCVYESANQALVHRRGDCFVFYSISELLLTTAGVPNMRIDRVGGRSRHAWNLINPDNLGWHHFDTTPLIVRQLDRFMFTQSQAEDFTRIIQSEGQGRDYFTFDPELYPEIAR